ncbi:tight adherence protein C [Loktanella ponticola]|uniref:Tight adherence protein C n=1 Tax=Yoonia ponticola TaxID=1524255 RepID=A0A7W9EZS0_9RHOB|nr:type II secretion system F family protein [Yoonia ponticola]MBB5722470.1 tight adherence protein C [Yoonia ponticola]
MEFIDNAKLMLESMLGPFGPLMLVGGLGFTMILITLPVLLKKRDDPLDRLKASTRTTEKLPGKPEKLRAASGRDKLEKYANFLEPQDAEEFSAVKLKLMQAGYQGKNAVRMYHFAQFALGVIGLIIGVIYAMMNTSGQDVTTQDLLIWVLIPGGAFYMLPKYWVTRRQAMRNEAITHGFPDSLDMMLVCVEAGQSLDQSIIRVSRELKSGFPELAGEFELVSNEMKAGKDKGAVLKDMAERCGVQDITSFVTVLVQSQQFGTSISDALRVYASEMRDKRVMRAEEAANKLPTKMTLATMMLTVPPLLLILIGPSLYGISQNLGGG